MADFPKVIALVKEQVLYSLIEGTSQIKDKYIYEQVQHYVQIDAKEISPDIQPVKVHMNEDDKQVHQEDSKSPVLLSSSSSSKLTKKRKLDDESNEQNKKPKIAEVHKKTAVKPVAQESDKKTSVDDKSNEHNKDPNPHETRKKTAVKPVEQKSDDESSEDSDDETQKFKMIYSRDITKYKDYKDECSGCTGRLLYYVSKTGPGWYISMKEFKKLTGVKIEQQDIYNVYSKNDLLKKECLLRFSAEGKGIGIILIWIGLLADCIQKDNYPLIDCINEMCKIMNDQN